MFRKLNRCHERASSSHKKVFGVMRIVCNQRSIDRFRLMIATYLSVMSDSLWVWQSKMLLGWYRFIAVRITRQFPLPTIVLFLFE